MKTLNLMLWVALVLGCAQDEPVPPASSIEPGVGVAIAGEPLHLGAPWADVTTRHGVPPVHRELGVLGARFEFPAAGISGHVQDGAVTRLTLYAGFDGATAAGIGVGATRSAVTEAYGEGAPDTFIGATFYRAQGLVFEWADDAVARVHLVAPQP